MANSKTRELKGSETFVSTDYPRSERLRPTQEHPIGRLLPAQGFPDETLYPCDP